MHPETPADLERDPADNTLAGLAHLSFFVGHLVLSAVFLGVLQDRREYVRFQVAQAFASQLVGVVGLVLYVLFFVVVVAGGVLASAWAPNSPAPLALFALFPIHFAVIGGTILSHIGLGTVGMMRCLQGKDHVIPVVGTFVFERWFRGKRAP